MNKPTKDELYQAIDDKDAFIRYLRDDNKRLVGEVAYLRDMLRLALNVIHGVEEDNGVE